mgnify:CR=1 FL=1
MITLKAVKRKNPKTKEDAFYPAVSGTSPMDFDSFVDSIARESTIARPDVVATLSALEEQVAAALLDGKSVRLGTLGSFRLTAKAKGRDVADDVIADDIEQLRVQFTPSRMLKEAVAVNPAAQGMKLVMNRQA